MLATALLLAAPAHALDQVIDPDFVYDVVDAGFCSLPSAEVTDEDLIASLEEVGDHIPNRGTITAPVGGALLGNGYFTRDAGSEAVMAGITNLIVADSGALYGLCMALVPIADTAISSGEIGVFGPGAEPSGGPAYLAVTRIIGRDAAGETVNLAEILRGEGSITFTQSTPELVEGTLTLTGDIDTPSSLLGSLDISFDFALDPGLTGFLRLEANE